MDSEYCTLQKEIQEATEFQSVLRAHKNFLSNMLRLSLIDNVSIQEGIERILQICLRFIAICRIMHQSEFLDEQDNDASNFASASAGASGSGSATGNNNNNGVQQRPFTRPIFIPPEELGFIRKDFFTQVSMLFQIMRKVDSRGFIFRLDFNGYLSSQQ